MINGFSWPAKIMASPFKKEKEEKKGAKKATTQQASKQFYCDPMGNETENKRLCPFAPKGFSFDTSPTGDVGRPTELFRTSYECLARYFDFSPMIDQTTDYHPRGGPMPRIPWDTLKTTSIWLRFDSEMGR